VVRGEDTAGLANGSGFHAIELTAYRPGDNARRPQNIVPGLEQIWSSRFEHSL
jgi:hypothetical protein